MGRPAPLPRPALGDTDAPERLDFLERLFVAPDEAAGARLTLDFLAQQTGVTRGVCALADLRGGRLVGVAGLGVPESAVARFTVDLEDRHHLLGLALQSSRPVAFNPGRRGRWLPNPLGRVAFYAVPITRFDRREEPGLGLLLLSLPRASQPSELVTWSANMLGVRVRGLRYPLAQLELGRVERERGWLRAVLNAVTDPILLTDADGRILLTNGGAERLLSSTEDDSEGRRRAVALNNMLFSATLTSGVGAPARRELLLVDPREGNDLLFELLIAPVQLRAGETGVAAILRDVTDLHRASEEIEQSYRRLRRAEAEAREERDRLDVMLSAVAEPVLVTDPRGNIMVMNPPAERLFAADAGARGGRELVRRVAANDAVFSSFLANLAADHVARWRGELAFVDPRTGETTQVEAIAGKVFSRTGEETAIVTILHDLTEAMEKASLYEQVKRHSEELRERVQEATGELAEQNELLRRQALQLEQASAMKSQFLANISHELRTPLNAIIGYTHLLLEGVAGELTATQGERLRRVDANARHLLSIINDLLDITRIESGKMPLQLETFALRDVVVQVTAEMEPLIVKSGLDLRVEIESRVPSVHSDRKKVKQILLNLLSNALKFTAAGSVVIRAYSEPDGKRVALAVSDTGPGIPVAKQSRIFEAFAQEPSAPAYGGAPGTRGTGLGLSICRRLAQLLGGEVTLESREGQGSTFTLLLPRRPSAR